MTRYFARGPGISYKFDAEDIHEARKKALIHFAEELIITEVNE